MALEEPRPVLTPEALFARFRETRDPAALGALFDAAAPGLFRLALSLTSDASRAEDALQETFLFALEEVDRWDPARPVVPWLMTVLRFKVKEARRREARTPDPQRLDLPPDSDDPAALAESAEERERLYEAMRRLPEPYRGVALLRWRYGHEPAEIADIRGEPPGTVWSLLHRALKKLKVEMGAMPALLLAFRPERGLDGVRRALLRRATAGATATATAGAGAAVGTASVATAGGILMAGKVFVVAAAVLLTAGAAWLVLRPHPVTPFPVTSVDYTYGERTARPATPRPAASPGGTDPAEGLPFPASLTGCDRDLDLFGVVVDGKGNPVAGASLRTLLRPWRRVAYGQEEFNRTVDGPSAESAPDGSFRLRLRRTDVVDLVVSAKGFPDRVIAQCPAGERLRVVLSAGAGLAVTARDEDGAPLQGVAVRLRGSVLFRSLQPEGRTNAEGMCLLSGLPPGQTFVEFSAEGRAASRSPTSVTIPESGQTDLAVVLPKGRVLSGIVQDATSGKPIPGAKVGSGILLDAAVTTDEGGRYEFRGWPKGDERDLVAEATGYGRLAVPVDKGDGIDFALSPGDEVTGRVLGPDGAPVMDAPLLVYGAEPGNGGGRQMDMLLAMSGPEGRFRLGGVNRAFGHHVLVAAPGFGRHDAEFTPRAGGPGTIDLGDLRVGTARSVSGIVRDGAGRPMEEVEVTLTPEGDAPDEPFPPLGERRRTDDLGRFLFPEVRPGPWLAVARVMRAPRLTRSVVVPEDKDLAGVILEPAPEPKPPGGPGRLRVLVRGPAGEPLPGIPVSVVGLDRNTIATRPSGPDGSVAFPEVSAARVLVQACESSRFMGKLPKYMASPLVPASPAEGEIVLTLQEASFVKGSVVGPEGKPLQGMCVHAKGPSGGSNESTYTNDLGEFTLAAERGVETEVTLPGWRQTNDQRGESGKTAYRTEPRTVVAPAEGIVLQAREIATGKKVTLLVLDLEGRPVPMCYVYGGSGPVGGIPPHTGDDGRVELTGLMEEPTRFDVDVPDLPPQSPHHLPDDWVAPERVPVVPAGQEVVLRLRRGVPRSGTVLDVEGHPAARAHVRLQTADYIVSRGAWTDGAGRFTAWVTPGQPLMRATASFDLGKKGPSFVAILEGSDIPAEGDIVLRLEPSKGR